MHSELVFFDRSEAAQLPGPSSPVLFQPLSRQVADDVAANDGAPSAALDDHFPWHRIRRLTRK